MINDDDTDYYDYDTFIRHQVLAAIHHIKTQPRPQMLSQSKLQKHLHNNTVYGTLGQGVGLICTQSKILPRQK